MTLLRVFFSKFGNTSLPVTVDKVSSTTVYFEPPTYRLFINQEVKEHGRYDPEFDTLYKTPRRLTQRECARLMDFEDVNAPSSEFRIVCADVPAYKQFGNSVVPVFGAVAKLLAHYV